jgi:Cellulose binding domain
MTVEYAVEISTAMTSAIGSQLWVVNNGSSAVSLDDLTARYYLTNEVTAPLTKTINWANSGPVGGAASGFPTGNITITVVPLSVPVSSADTYVEFGFTGNSMLSANSYVQFSWTIQNFMSQDFKQTGDYSFNAADTSETVWANVTLYYKGQSVVWGVPP